MNVVWSSDMCQWCTKAKELLDTHGFKYEVRNALEEPEEFTALFPEAKTVPQIIFNGEHVGGYENLVQAFEDQNIFIGGTSIV